MIISRTPYRVSLAGGGTDLPAFHRRESGAVLGTTIDRHMSVTIRERSENSIRIGYSRAEMAEAVDAIGPDLVREAMKPVEVDESLEIATIGDVPAGTGMGSGSSLAAGLLNAPHASRGRVVGRAAPAEQACEIEVEILKEPIVRQDRSAAAFGGLDYSRLLRRTAPPGLGAEEVARLRDRRPAGRRVVRGRPPGRGDRRQAPRGRRRRLPPGDGPPGGTGRSARPWAAPGSRPSRSPATGAGTSSSSSERHPSRSP